jgi:hypothetical protein
MGWLYKNLLRPALFVQDSEVVHNRTLRALAWASRHKTVCATLGAFLKSPELPV